MSDIKDICFDYFNGISTAEQETEISAFVRSSEDNMRLFKEWEAEWRRQKPECAQVFRFSRVNDVLKSRKRSRRNRLYMLSAVAAAGGTGASIIHMPFLAACFIHFPNIFSPLRPALPFAGMDSTFVSAYLSISAATESLPYVHRLRLSASP